MKLLLAATALLALTLTARAEDTKFTVGGNNFVAPAPFKEGGEAGMFDKFVLTYPVEGGKGILAKFSDFPAPAYGGGVDGNLKRWSGQFGGGAPETKREDLKFGDVEVVLVTYNGTYLDGPPMADAASKTPRPDYTFLGAIIINKDFGTFVKFIGPKADVAKAADAFKKLVLSPFPAK
jgi:hypothetical protein